MKTFKSFREFGEVFKEELTKDITKYSSKDLSNNAKHGKPIIAFSKFLYMDDSSSGKAASGQPKGKEEGTAIYMTVTKDTSGEYLYPKNSFYVGHDRVNTDGQMVMGWTGTARLVTYDKKDAITYIKKFGNLAFQKKQIEKGNKGWDAWPPTYDLTGDFIGQGPGSKIKKITSLDQIKY
tara:strand:- start:695 stop:1231 length:537 start_codon:yes stop_codon:yes gene_type:complete